MRDQHLRRVAVGILASRALGHHRPIYTNIEPTHCCNLNCTFCDKGTAKGPMLPTDAAKQIIRELAAAGCSSVCFDGGEPLVHPGIDDLISAARSAGVRVTLSTNGTLIPDHLDALQEVRNLKVSMDGPEHIHDIGRGAGAWRRAMRGIEAALARNIHVTLRMTLTAHNLGHYEEVLQLAGRLKCGALFQPGIGSIMDLDRGPDESSPPIEGYRRTIAELLRRRRQGEAVANADLCLEHLAHWPAPVAMPFCAGGRIQAAIGPDGSMYPCGRWGRHRPAPNVLALGVQEAFARLEQPRFCTQCWCTLTAETCYAYRLDPRLARGSLRRQVHTQQERAS
jgi:MoaA/NifB/PqqE/SkfB family radical SAM enzyme